MSIEEAILATLILLTALLYSSVGHGGASGYLAAMALLGLAPDVMRPVALMLNILVASIALVKFCRVGAFSWKLFWPFAFTSVPFAYLGGTMTLPGHIYKPLVGVVLLFSAWHIYHTTKRVDSIIADRPPLPKLLAAGAALGFLSGLTGVGRGNISQPAITLLSLGRGKSHLWHRCRIHTRQLDIGSIGGGFGATRVAHSDHILGTCRSAWRLDRC